VSTDVTFGASTSFKRGDGVVDSDHPLASQSAMSHLLALLSTAGNLSHLQAAVQNLVIEHMRVRNGGRLLSLSSSPRSKSHYRQVPIAREEGVEVKEDTEVVAENAVRLQIYLLVYKLFYISRCTLHSPPPPVESETDEDPQAPTQGVEDLRETVPSETQLDESTEAVLKTEVEPHLDADDSTAVDPVSAEVPHLHINSFRLYLLKVGATLARHACYVTFYIAFSAVQAWQCFWEHFQQLRWHACPTSDAGHLI